MDTIKLLEETLMECDAKLKKFTPGSKEYEATAECYSKLLNQYNALCKSKADGLRDERKLELEAERNAEDKALKKRELIKDWIKFGVGSGINVGLVVLVLLCEHEGTITSKAFSKVFTLFKI